MDHQEQFYCLECGKAIKTGQKFCTSCGAKLREVKATEVKQHIKEMKKTKKSYGELKAPYYSKKILREAEKINGKNEIKKEINASSKVTSLNEEIIINDKTREKRIANQDKTYKEAKQRGYWVLWENECRYCGVILEEKMDTCPYCGQKLIT